MANDITFQEYLTLSRITFEWADSYDAKVSFNTSKTSHQLLLNHTSNQLCTQQFDRLKAILGPSVTLDYSDAFGQKPITMPRDAFMELSDNKNRLGGIVDCIHHIGGSKYDRTGPDSVTGFHQVRPISTHLLLLNICSRAGHHSITDCSEEVDVC